MSQVLKLESFRRVAEPAPPPEPTFSAADLAQARAEGRAEGVAAAADADRAAMVQAVSDLAAALRDDAARRAAMAAVHEAELAPLICGLSAALAGPLRAGALADRVVQAVLRERAADDALPAVIRCEALAAEALSRALQDAGIEGVAVEPTAPGSGAEFAVGGGLLRLSPARIEAALEDIIAEIGAEQEGG